MRGVWVRRGIGLPCFVLAVIPVFFLAQHAGVRQEALYDFQEDSVREAYSCLLYTSIMSVSTAPGAMQFTVTPLGRCV